MTEDPTEINHEIDWDKCGYGVDTFYDRERQEFVLQYWFHNGIERTMWLQEYRAPYKDLYNHE